ncbi:MAG: hypothetical protein P1U40_07575 [Coxiellaceae bacterium]|nr:hypothetical protein [Coxiellaceae bacterium]
MKPLIISCFITAAIALPASSLVAATPADTNANTNSSLVAETPPNTSSDTPLGSSSNPADDPLASTNANTTPDTSADTSSEKPSGTSAIKPCKLVSDFQATNRYVYQCKSGESYNIDAAKLRHCKTGGIAKEDSTVSKNIYSLFCNDGSSTTATCTNGFFNKPHQLMINGTKQIVITCQDNS